VIGPVTPIALEELDLQYIDGHDWLITNEFLYVPRRFPDRVVVIAPRTKTDFASIPRFLWPVFPPTGDGPRKRYGPGAALHDQLYRSGTWGRVDELGEYRTDGPPCSQVDADAVLYDAMAELDVRATTRWPIYLGVRAGGWYTWANYRAKEAAAAAAVV